MRRIVLLVVAGTFVLSGVALAATTYYSGTTSQKSPTGAHLRISLTVSGNNVTGAYSADYTGHAGCSTVYSPSGTKLRRPITIHNHKFNATVTLYLAPYLDQVKINGTVTATKITGSFNETFTSTHHYKCTTGKVTYTATKT